MEKEQNRIAGQGDLLIATASLVDPNFQQTVVLVCEHDAYGAYGLILNRPASPTEEALEKMPFLEGRLFQGGPVEQNGLQALHPYGDHIDETFEVLPGVWIGGNLEQLEQGFDTGYFSPDQCRFFVGYSGWDSEQLAAEFTTSSWQTVPGSKELVLDTPPERLWGAAIRSRAPEEPLYSVYPDDPRWN